MADVGLIALCFGHIGMKEHLVVRCKGTCLPKAIELVNGILIYESYFLSGKQVVASRFYGMHVPDANSLFVVPMAGAMEGIHNDEIRTATIATVGAECYTAAVPFGVLPKVVVTCC